jgi:hypothetical protein
MAVKTSLLVLIITTLAMFSHFPAPRGRKENDGGEHEHRPTLT